MPCGLVHYADALSALFHPFCTVRDVLTLLSSEAATRAAGSDHVRLEDTSSWK